MRPRHTYWTQKYWTLLDRLYWSPQYLGLKSIPRRIWSIDGTNVSIPRDMTNPNGPLYRRIRSGNEYWTYVVRQEEVFSYLFDLSFAILPGDVIAQILDPLVGAGTHHQYEMLGGKTLRERYGAKENANITTPDGFFVAPESILALELKFNAKASLDQLAKYVMLFTAEQQKTGNRDRLNLLFIFNTSDPDSTLEKNLGVKKSQISPDLIDDLVGAVDNKVVKPYLSNHRELVKSTLSRLKVSCANWTALADALGRFSAKLDVGGSMGDRTLKRLVDGIVAEIHQHPLSNVQGSGGYERASGAATP